MWKFLCIFKQILFASLRGGVVLGGWDFVYHTSCILYVCHLCINTYLQL